MPTRSGSAANDFGHRTSFSGPYTLWTEQDLSKIWIRIWIEALSWPCLNSWILNWVHCLVLWAWSRRSRWSYPASHWGPWSRSPPHCRPPLHRPARHQSSIAQILGTRDMEQHYRKNISPVIDWLRYISHQGWVLHMSNVCFLNV